MPSFAQPIETGGFKRNAFLDAQNAGMAGAQPAMQAANIIQKRADDDAAKAETEKQRKEAQSFIRLLQSGETGVNAFITDVEAKDQNLGEKFRSEWQRVAPALSDPSMTGEKARDLLTSQYKSWVDQISEADFAKQSEGQDYDTKLGTAQKVGAIDAKEMLSMGRPSRTTLTGTSLTDEQIEALKLAREKKNEKREELGRDLSKQEIDAIFQEVGLPPTVLGNKAVREFLGQGVSSASGEAEKSIDAANAADARKFYTENQTPDGGKPPKKVVPKAARADTKAVQDDYDNQLKQADYGTIAVRSGQIRDLLARGTQASDIGAFYAFIKLIDPPSVVRESEVGLVTNVGSVYDKFKQKYLAMTGDALLDAKVRLEFWDAAKTILNVYNQYYKSLNKNFEERAKKLGVDKYITMKDVNIDAGDLEIAGVEPPTSNIKVVPTKKPPKPHVQDSEAVKWAKANPKDPRAIKILALNGSK